MNWIFIFNKIINLVYENSCYICNEASKELVVCKNCENSFIQRNGKNCKSFKDVEVFSWGFYSGRLRDGMIKLKAGKKKLANYFSKNLVDLWGNIPSEIKNKEYLVIPVPSHKKRIKERGYCQSSLIAKDFARSLNYNFSNQFVIRTKETKYMNSLNTLNDRIINIKNAFKTSEQIPKEKNILMIDDILTSGNTICELARTIHKKYPDLNLLGLTVASGDTYN